MAIDLTAVTLTELRYIVAAAEYRHFGRAARASSVTQPTLSAQVQKLERTLGVRIFERTSKSVHLTPVGAEIVEQARVVLDAAERILDLAQSKKDPLSGPLHLGVIPTLSPYLLPWLVPALRRDYPRLQLVLREMKTADVLEELTRHRLDCGMLALPVPHAGIVCERVFDEPFWLIAPIDHALAGKRSVQQADLKGERVLLLDEGHCLRDQALDICGDPDAEQDLPGDFRATSIETLRQLVAAGMGITLLPALAVSVPAHAVAGVVQIPFRSPAPVRRIALCWRKTHPRASDYRVLAQFIRERAPDAVRPVTENVAKRTSRELGA